MDIANAQTALTGMQDDTTLCVTGAVSTPLRLSIDALRDFENTLADPFALRCFSTNRLLREVGRYRGVLLRDLIARAGLRNEAPTDFKRTVIVAIAHDGYTVTFSWHELFNTRVGERALVAYECDGKALSADEGAPILFSGADILPAPRHVNRLAQIVVHVVRL
jgi:DMSO/TMAO reductase YedYZ molybdopterin-dependent catalytic subunit